MQCATQRAWLSTTCCTSWWLPLWFTRWLTPGALASGSGGCSSEFSMLCMLWYSNFVLCSACCAALGALASGFCGCLSEFQCSLHALVPFLVLCCAVLCCAVLCCAVLCCAVLCCAVLCCAVLCCAVLCCAVLCCAVLCCAVAGGCFCFCYCFYFCASLVDGAACVQLLLPELMLLICL